MRIRNQTWIETDTHLVLTLHQPFWSAWKKYGWETQQEGLGVSREAVKKALELGKKLRINVLKYGSYEISPKKALRIASSFTFKPRDGKTLLIIPRLECERINVSAKIKKEEKREEVRASKNREVENKDIYVQSSLLAPPETLLFFDGSKIIINK
jgi:hypothetical protein